MSNLGRRISTAGLLAALVLIAGSGEADAGLGIVVTDTTLMPVADPLTEYDFKLSLIAGNQLLQGDNITLMNIPDFDGTASYKFVSNGFDFSTFFAIVPSAGSGPGLTNIELEYIIPPPSSFYNSQNPSLDLPIGDLFVETSVDFPPPADSPLFNPVAYTTQTHLFPSGAPNSGAGITTPHLVPEPASLALMGVGLGSAWLLARRRRAGGVSPAS